MATFLKDHNEKEDIYLGYDSQETEPESYLVDYRNNILFNSKKVEDPEKLINKIFNKNRVNSLDNLSPANLQIITDIYYLIGIHPSFIHYLEDYISKIDYPYRFRDIKIVKIYKKICIRYNIQEHKTIYKKILNDKRKCDCVVAIKNVIIDRYKTLDTVTLINILDLVSNKDKHKILDTLLTKSYDARIFGTKTIYEKDFLIYLARLIYRLNLHNLNISDIDLKHSTKKLLNLDKSLDYVLTIENEENRKLIDLPRLFKNFNYDYIDTRVLLLLYNLSKSIYILRSEFIKYPITEILVGILLKEQVNTKNYEGLHFEELQTDYRKIILDILTNLLLEFGNYRLVFKSMNGLEIIEKLKFEYPVEILRIYKNYLYDNTLQNKNDFLKYGDQWFMYFINIQTNSDEIRNIMFNLIRNLVCDKIFISEYLINLIFFHLIDNSSSTTLTHILYAIANISVNKIEFRDLLLKNEKVLRRIKDLFFISDLKLPLLWIIINLTWKDEGYEERVEIINSFRIKEDILNIITSDSELIDKIHIALDNLKDLNNK